LFDGAFLPQQFGLYTRGYSGAGGAIPRHATIALYASDAAGEPDKLVARTDPPARSDSLDGALEVGLEIQVLPKVLASGRYWLMIAFNVPTTVYEDTLDAPVEYRSVPYHVDYNSNQPPADRFKDNGPVTKSMGRAPNFYMKVDPK
jgi:hypothetical protein